jgi:nicotinamide-nucleotide amidase
MTAQSCIPASLVRAAEWAMRRLKTQKLTAVTAESCTAGLIAASLSMAEGAGDLLHGSFVTYTKEAKSRALGVPRALLSKEGSVTRRVASDMLRGALRHSAADIALAVTGVLGPEPDEDGNPVGLVFIACQRRGARPTVVQKRYGKRSAEQLRRRTVLDALRLLDAETTKNRRNS